MSSNKLIFKKISAKNFRSVGNMPLELDYLSHNSTLIASEDNGSGKSTLAIWALYYVLFGEPYSPKCKIGGLVNSKSGKDMVVEFNFETQGKQWKVRRGYKPAIYELYCEGKLIENEADNRDPQAYLQSVIGMDKRAFCNIVALGLDRFVPFVEMKTQERRDFVEQMLDMVIISHMNTIAKDRTKAVRKVIEQLNYDIGIVESKVQGRRRTIQILEDKKQQRLAETGSELDGLRKSLNEYVQMDNKVGDKLEELKTRRIPGALEALSKVRDMQNRFKVKVEEIRRNASKIEELHDCPTCKQGVTSDHKEGIRAAAEAEAEKLLAPIEKLGLELARHQADVDSNHALDSEEMRVNGMRLTLQTRISSTQTQIRGIEAKLVDSNEDEMIQSEKDAADELQTELDAKIVELNKQTESETEHLQLLQILKDDGIKASIVAQYVPVLNQKINEILDRLNLYVQINIDSEFNVEMFAPDRKGQTLGNLSTGQLRRIDIAVLLAWREIAKTKASVDCNVLIMDEILENLSASGVEEFMDMWMTFGQETNLMVISQRAAEFDEYFDRCVKYRLKDGMTVEV